MVKVPLASSSDSAALSMTTQQRLVEVDRNQMRSVGASHHQRLRRDFMFLRNFPRLFSLKSLCFDLCGIWSLPKSFELQVPIHETENRLCI